MWRVVGDFLSENQALLPAVGAVVGALLAFALGASEPAPADGGWAITAGEVRNLLLTGLSLLFAGLAIVIAMASATLQNVVGKFSPRIVRIYTRDPWDKAVIATFAMAAAYAATLWLQMRAFATDDLAPTDAVLVGVLLIGLTGSSMIWYTGALVRWFRVDRVLSLLSRLALSAARSDSRPAGAETVSLKDGDPTLAGHSQPLPAAEPGYLAAVDVDGLLELAEEHDVAFSITRELGSRVARGGQIGTVVTDERGDGIAPPLPDIANQIAITPDRPVGGVLGFEIVVMVDIAIMALSPAVNDPNTAVQVIEEMAVLFTRLTEFEMGPYALRDRAGGQRVMIQSPTFAEYLELATTQIILYGSDDPLVARALVRFGEVLEVANVPQHERQAVQDVVGRLKSVPVSH